VSASGAQTALLDGDLLALALALALALLGEALALDVLSLLPHPANTSDRQAIESAVAMATLSDPIFNTKFTPLIRKNDLWKYGALLL